MNTEFNKKSPRAKKRAAKWRLAQMIKMESGCVDCGYNKSPVALQFDHVFGNKKSSVSNLIRSDYCWETILEEIKKCEVRCANCHAVVTAHRKLSYHESDQSVLHSVS
jgi:aerobic-type carbon monoxide dehydrogenase small subunit (CoxS/CutS family)